MSEGRARARRAAKGVAFVASSLAVTFLLFVPLNLAHLRLIGADVILYASVFDGLLASLLYAALYAGLLRRQLPRTGLEVGATTLAAFLACALYSVLVPTLVERSLSVYLLRTLGEGGGSATRAELEEVVRERYPPEMDVLAARLREQRASGTVVVEGDRVTLTDRGRLVVELAGLYRQHFLPGGDAP